MLRPLDFYYQLYYSCSQFFRIKIQILHQGWGFKGCLALIAPVLKDDRGKRGPSVCSQGKEVERDEGQEDQGQGRDRWDRVHLDRFDCVVGISLGRAVRSYLFCALGRPAIDERPIW